MHQYCSWFFLWKKMTNKKKNPQADVLCCLPSDNDRHRQSVMICLTWSVEYRCSVPIFPGCYIGLSLVILCSFNLHIIIAVAPAASIKLIAFELCGTNTYLFFGLFLCSCVRMFVCLFCLKHEAFISQKKYYNHLLVLESLLKETRH